jgi:hypothetical protein
MATAAAMRTALERLGASQDATRAIVNDQGIASLDELKVLQDDDVCVLCKTVRRPGGVVPNPNAAEAGQPATIPNNGVAVTVRFEANLKLAVYMVRHRLNRISRPCTIESIDVDNVRKYQQMKDVEAAYTKPDTKPTINDKDWPKTMEAIQEYLSRVLGEGGLPLAYIIRKDRPVRDDAVDRETNYTSNPVYEMICRAPHFTTGEHPTETPTYGANNRKVAEELTDIFRDHAAYTYGKVFLRRGDGRLGYYAIYDHYLGPNSVNNQSAAAEKLIANLTYSSESRRWDFEKFATTMKEQHQILDGLKDYGYSGVDKTTKVRQLLDGIKNKDLEPAIAMIMADDKFQSDFDLSVAYIKSFLKQKQTQGTTTRQISEVDIQGDVEDRYYSKEEYKALPGWKKEALREMRKKRGHKPGSGSKAGNGNGNPNGPSNKKQKTMQRKISKMEKKLADLNEKLDAASAKKDVPDTVSTDSSAAESNRTNPALSRQKTQG